MKRDLKPLNVSPVIKTARWSLLFLGYIYGMRRKHSLELIEVNKSPVRRKMLEERNKSIAYENEKKVRRDLLNICAELGVTDIPPEYREN